MPARKKSLAHGRPPTFRKPQASLSSKATRTLIRTHHQLQKEHAKALASGDTAKAEDLQKQIDENGGLKSYQAASITGQSSERGGDSSKVLMDWLNLELKKSRSHEEANAPVYRLLEVGALSPSNACSRSSSFSVTRIDLHSQHPGIETQDFMQRPLPTSEEEKFHLISLSLVLNYVPDAVGRGEMLRKTTMFLRTNEKTTSFPSLFLVLPAPCVKNSRYLDEALLQEIMESLGYSLLQQKISNKLVYYLWKYSVTELKVKKQFPKTEVNPGKTRNNFCVVLR